MTLLKTLFFGKVTDLKIGNKRLEEIKKAKKQNSKNKSSAFDM